MTIYTLPKKLTLLNWLFKLIMIILLIDKENIDEKQMADLVETD